MLKECPLMSIKDLLIYFWVMGRSLDTHHFISNIALVGSTTTTKGVVVVLPTSAMFEMK